MSLLNCWKDRSGGKDRVHFLNELQSNLCCHSSGEVLELKLSGRQSLSLHEAVCCPVLIILC